MNQSDTPFIDGDTISWWKFDQFRIPLPHLKNLHPLTEPSKQPFCRFHFCHGKISLAKLIDEGVAMLFFPPLRSTFFFSGNLPISKSHPSSVFYGPFFGFFDSLFLHHVV